MSKILFENKKNRILIINKLSYPEAVNERVYNAIISGTFESFIPVTLKQKRKETRIECAIEGLIPLNAYFSGIISKADFLDIVYKIALIIKSCDKNMINSGNLDLQIDRVFVEPRSRSVKCIYWPVVNNQQDTPAYAFLRQLPYTFNFNSYENTTYLQQYNSFFQGVAPFSINSFVRLIETLQGKENVGYQTPSERLTDKPNANLIKQEAEKANPNIAYDPFSAPKDAAQEIVYCRMCGAKNSMDYSFCHKCGNRLQSAEQKSKTETAAKSTKMSNGFEKTPAMSAPAAMQMSAVTVGTTVLGDNAGGTTVLGYAEVPKPAYPYLIREKNGEKISVNKPVFRIGKEKRYCDYFVFDNSAVSRSHANIITKNGRFFIVDLNSTNRTYVDGRVIPVGQEVEIFSKTKLRLANEDFVFYVE